MVSDAYPILKDTGEFHNLLTVACIAATLAAPQTTPMKDKSERRKKSRQDSPQSDAARKPERQRLELSGKATSRRETSEMRPLPPAKASRRQKAAQERDLRGAVSARRQSVGRAKPSRCESSLVIAADTSDSQGDGHSGDSNASSDIELRRVKTSARGKNRRLVHPTQCFGGCCKGSQKRLQT